MINPELIAEFEKYVKTDSTKKSWVGMGLVDDAPMSAQIAFEHYIRLIQDTEQEGLEL
jgi:hypothetical protein